MQLKNRLREKKRTGGSLDRWYVHDLSNRRSGSEENTFRQAAMASGKVARSERPSVVSKATSCFSRPLSHLCLSNPASRSILAFDGSVHSRWITMETCTHSPPLDHSLSARCTRYFPPLSSLDPQMNPPLRRVAFDRISDGARGRQRLWSRRCFDQPVHGWKRKRRVRVRVRVTVGLWDFMWEGFAK